jgi:S1-C subfamily serine protease
VLGDGAAVPATLAGRDPGTDLALLRVAARGLAAVAWSDDVPRAGHLVLGVSHSGRGPRAALGLVTESSGAWRTAAGGQVDRYLETDLALRPGYSGSLLADTEGRALGLNTAGLFRGTGVAVPGATVRRVAESLATHGHVRRGYLGVGTMPVALGPDQAQALSQDGGLLVTSVQAGAPAHRAGIQLGDVLLAFDGQALTRPRDLLARLDEDAVGRAVTLRVLRGGQPAEATVTVGSRDRSVP